MSRTIFVALIAMSLFLAPVQTIAGDVVKKKVDGSKVRREVKKVTNIYDWSRSFDELKREAQNKKKMIFWLQIVGELEGGL